jgi:hypothetical protein
MVWTQNLSATDDPRQRISLRFTLSFNAIAPEPAEIDFDESNATITVHLAASSGTDGAPLPNLQGHLSIINYSQNCRGYSLASSCLLTANGTFVLSAGAGQVHRAAGSFQAKDELVPDPHACENHLTD